MRNLTIMICMALAACTLTTRPVAPVASEKNEAAELPVAERDTGFLYMAAERAILNGRPELAIRFLTALVEKDPSALRPRIQLVELLLRKQQITEAEKHVNALLAMHDLPPDIARKVRVLRARTLAASGKNDMAITVLQPLLKASPNAYSIRLTLIQLLAAEERYSEAHDIIREGIKIGTHPQLYHIEAELYLRQGKLKEAEMALRAMKKQAPDQAGPVLLLSRMARQQGKMMEAEEILRTFLSRHPGALSVSNALGRMLVQQGRNREAIAIYEDISRRTGNHPEVLIALGLLYYQQKDYARAVATFRKVLTKSPSNKARFYLAASLEASGKNDEAAGIYRQIKRDTASYLEARLRLAAIELQAGRVRAAIVSLRKIIKAFPGAASAYTMLSAALLQQKKYRELLAQTEVPMGLEKPPVQLMFNRAAAYEGLKQYGNAIALLKKLFTIEPDNPEALNFLGYIYAEQGAHLDEAEGLIRRALQRKPGNGYYLDSMAWVYFKRGDYGKALEFQHRAVRKIPDDPIMQEHLGDILWKAGKADAARRAWKKTLRLGHDNPGLIRKKIGSGL